MLASNALRRAASPSVALTRTRPFYFGPLADTPLVVPEGGEVRLLSSGSSVVRCNRRMGRVRCARRWPDSCLFYELFRLLALDGIIYIYINSL